MTYTITPYTYQRAKEIDVVVKPSTVKGKKIDVYDEGKKVASIGSISMGDYPTYLKEYGKEYAEGRRRAFHARFTKNTLKIKLVKYLLW